MRVLLTGATGFIGSHVARELLRHQCEVVALIRPTASLHRIADLISRLTIVYGSLETLDTIWSTIESWHPEGIIHLAWPVEPGNYLHSPANIVALRASLDLLERTLASGCRRIVMAGTCLEYDTAAGWMHEAIALNPTTLYAAAKAALGQVGIQRATQAGAHFAWGRIFYLYGAGEDERRLIAQAITTLLRQQPLLTTAGEQVRDYLHVEDVARALVHLLRHDAHGAYNIASGEPLTLRRLLGRIGDLLGRSELIQLGALPYRIGDPPFICGDTRRLRSLGWQPSLTLEDGLQQTIEWWRRYATHD